MRCRRRRSLDGKSWLVNQDVEIPQGASNIHGIKTADIRATGIRPHDSLSALFEAMRKAPTCMGHNIHRFDIGFMLADRAAKEARSRDRSRPRSLPARGSRLAGTMKESAS